MIVNGQDKKELIEQDQRLELWHKIWESRVGGKSSYKIAREFGLTVGQVNNILTDLRKELLVEKRQFAQNELDLDLARCDELISLYLPVARAMSVMVTKINSQGEAYTEDEWRFPMAAGKTVLQAIKMRSELMGYDKDKGGDKRTESSLWLRRIEESRAVQEEISLPTGSSGKLEEDPLDLTFPDVFPST